MKKPKTSLVLLGYKFTRSYYFKIWRLLCKFKKYTNPDWYQKYSSKSQKYSYYSSDWVKKVIIPSKAFQQWRKVNEVDESIRSIVFAAGKKYLPTKAKLFLKKNLPALFPTEVDPIPENIRLEWSKWLERREDNSVDIINFGVIAYDYRIQRPQHLAKELTNLGHRVFYIENEFTFAAVAHAPQIKITTKDNNLYAVKLGSSKNYFIYQDTVSAKDRGIIVASLKLLLKEANVINPIAKIDHPFWASIANELGMPIMYDAMDLHSGFKENSDSALQNEKVLLKKSDVILSSSDYISREFSQYKDKLLSLKNAGEYKHFSTSAKPVGSIPQEMKHLKGPIIGYYGALADWFNTDLIEGLAKDMPHASIVLIGLVNNARLLALADKYQNIHLLGEKPYKELPKYLSRFDVCLIPFKLNKLIQATNPVKIYEYFASGKPVVATSIPELKTYDKVMYFADNAKNFTQAVKKALSEKSSSLRKSRRTIAAANTWKDRAKTLEAHLQSTLFPKVSVIILVYNHADLSEISIDSTLYRSKYPNFEIIAVDNHSDAETIKMLQKYRKIKKVRLIFNQTNYGFAKGNNVGMAAAKGEYIILLNNDVRVTPGWIERLVYHAKEKGVGLVGPVTNSIGNESKINIAYDPDNQIEIEEQASTYTYSHWGEKLKLQNIAAFAWLMSRSVYKVIGGLDERFGRGLFEDDDYCIRIRNKKLTILCAEDSFVHHYGGASTNWGSPEYQKLFNENKAKFESKWGIKWTPHRHRKNL